MNIKKKNQPSPSDLDQFNNFCKAMAEQELFEAGVFPNATDAADVRAELTREDPKGAKIIQMKCIEAAGKTATKKHKWEMDELTGGLADAVSRQGRSIGSSHNLHRQQPAASGVDDMSRLKPGTKLPHE